MKLYGGDGRHGKCRGCGADGFWEILGIPDEGTVIQCECGHTEVV